MRLRTPIAAFTLIELLIVVAIIAILAAIAVPNFLEAQTRSKISRAKSDMRTMGVALQAYSLDNNNSFPQCNTFGTAGSIVGWNATVGGQPSNQDTAGILERLSTPVAYVTTAITRDAFLLNARAGGGNAVESMDIAATNPTLVSESTDAAGRLNSYIYQSWGYVGSIGGRAETPGNIRARQWLLHSAGPDSIYHNLGGVLASDRTIDGPILMVYDATNGTISLGSIYRWGGERLTPTASYAMGQGLVLATDRQN